MKNMKIEINEQQPLDEVVRELERLGFQNNTTHQCDYGCIYAGEDPFSDGLSFSNRDSSINWGELTTLAELKEM